MIILGQVAHPFRTERVIDLFFVLVTFFAQYVVVQVVLSVQTAYAVIGLVRTDRMDCAIMSRAVLIHVLARITQAVTQVVPHVTQVVIYTVHLAN